mmetsp:Transcript_89669/g.283863  ORF Transcript_89669/g.283863 Transcript_89669/m.283863 type:complete len:142 (-) Transcript_89669:110-535(-)
MGQRAGRLPRAVLRRRPFVPRGTDLGQNEMRNDWAMPRGVMPEHWPCAPWIENSNMLRGLWSELRADVFVDPCPRFWMRETHFFRFPHVIHVASIPELVLAPRAHDLLSVSRAMAKFNEATLQSSIRFYEWALSWLTSGAG